MSSKKKKGAQPSHAAVKKDLARLKKLGLYKGDLRKKPTRYGIKQTEKYKEVLSKRAKVVTLPSRKEARSFNEAYKTKYRKVVVPVRPGERIFYSKKSGEIFSYRKEYGRKIKRIFPKHGVTLANIDQLPQGKNITYAIPIGSGGAMERVTFSELKAFAEKYKKSSAWKAYLQILYDESDDIYGDDE